MHDESDRLIAIARELEARDRPSIAALVTVAARILVELDSCGKPISITSPPGLSAEGESELKVDQVRLGKLFEKHKEQLVSNPSSRADKNREGYHHSLARLQKILEGRENEPLLDVEGGWVQIGAHSSAGFPINTLLENLAVIALVFGKIDVDEARVFFGLHKYAGGLRFFSTIDNWKDAKVTCHQAAHLLSQFGLNDSQEKSGLIEISSLLKQANAAKKIILELQN